MAQPRIITPKSEYTVDYPVALDFTKKQVDVFWTPDEIEMEKDLHELKTGLTESELHGVITTLKLFTQYEIHVGNEYWGGIAKEMFPRPDIERMTNCFSFIEINVHAPFYAKINEVLGLATNEFYNSYKEDPALAERMDWIDKMVALPKRSTVMQKLLSIGAFSIVEGAILYSNFAFLKHFQANGKNKLTNLVAGINFSVRDENLHSLGGAWLFQTLLEESELKDIDKLELQYTLEDVCKQAYEHEKVIIAKVFEKGGIKGITANQMEAFIQSRLDLCLTNLGYDAIFKPTYNPIAKWFYKNISASVMHDFFSRQGNSYNRDWKEGGFKW
jgi:ribonucleotide reductase beta subunit family protein with ferritin-like domain